MKVTKVQQIRTLVAFHVMGWHVEGKGKKAVWVAEDGRSQCYVHEWDPTLYEQQLGQVRRRMLEPGFELSEHHDPATGLYHVSFAVVTYDEEGVDKCERRAMCKAALIALGIDEAEWGGA